jgi:DNA-binding beta-propeller fold protein YncE
MFAGDRSLLQIWFEGNQNLTTVYYPDIINPLSMFVTDNGEIYIGNGNILQVDKLSLNPEENGPIMNFKGVCYGIFVDIEDNLYCSVQIHNEVVKKSLKNNTNTITVAGNGGMGSMPSQLDNPTGIFVDINFDLYVADTKNNRIQLFHLGDVNGTTIVTKGLTKPLTEPTGIVLDGNGYLFIVDNGNHRIVASGPDGFRCLVGCRIRGSGPNHLNRPLALSFDTFGNMFVVDQYNYRIQKFFLKTNFCGNLSMKESQFP